MTLNSNLDDRSEVNRILCDVEIRIDFAPGYPSGCVCISDSNVDLRKQSTKCSLRNYEVRS
jgi:hypothetical protein